MAGTIIYYLYFLYIHTAGKRQMDTHNGIISSGRQIFIAGQIGWDETCTVHTDYFAEQAGQKPCTTLFLSWMLLTKLQNILQDWLGL